MDRTQWCENGQAHRGPFFTVSILALEVGPGSRQKNRTHILARKTLARLCATCLRGARLRLEGREFFTLASRDLTRD